MATAGIALAMISVFVQSEVKLPRYVLLSMALNDPAAMEDLRISAGQRLRLEQIQTSNSDITPAERYQLTGVWRFQRQSALTVVRWFPYLTPTQQKRFSELSLQTAGLIPWMDRRSTEIFSLSPASTSKVEDLIEKYNPYSRFPEPRFKAPKRNAPRSVLFQYWEDRRERERVHRERIAFESHKLVYAIMQSLPEAERAHVRSMYGRPYASRTLSPAGSVRAAILRDVNDPERLREVGTDPKYVRQAEAVRAVQSKSLVYTQRAIQRLTERRLQKLSEENVEQLFRAAVRNLGPSGLLLPEVAEALKLEPQQSEKIHLTLLACSGEPSPSESARIQAILSDEQRLRWQSIRQANVNVAAAQTRLSTTL